MNKIPVTEIFYSLQGEGRMAGRPSIFIRLSGCNQTCWFCDTNFNKYEKINIDDIFKAIKGYESKHIIWTGGEPTLQLTDNIVDYFKYLGYSQGIETNGSKKVPINIDYVSCSPKVVPNILKNTFSDKLVDEFRYAIGVGDTPPNIQELPKAQDYYISPLFLGQEKSQIGRASCRERV